ncbi:Transmembrane protein [Trema orientale]|uniref:Transmembrane protein n=1 Tax=Trema orientale TaxID=63057 RepID=A0A2P5BIG8_TREOI|nr:Transmembrane protein [Trema orientale]
MDPELYLAAASGDEITFENHLIEHPDSWRKKTCENNSVLHVAALNSQPNIVKKILPQYCQNSLFQFLLLRGLAALFLGQESVNCHEENRPLLYCWNSDQDTALHLAARVGCEEIVRLQICHATKIEGRVGKDQRLTRMTNLAKDSALHDAVRNGHLSTVELLLEEDPELAFLTNSAGESPLFLAVEGKFFDIARRLLQIDTKICSHAGRDGMNALHLAVVLLHRDLLNIMIGKFPLALGEQDNQGWTPLHYAVHLKFEGIIELLLSTEDKSSATKKDKTGMSAFHVATVNGYIDVMEKLRTICPDILELLAFANQTALHLAVRSKEKKTVEYLLRVMDVRRLLNKQDAYGNTPLHLAAKIENYDILLLFLDDNRVQGNFVNKDGLTAMDIFQSCNKLEESDQKLGMIISKLRSIGAFPCVKQQLIKERNIKLQNFMETVVVEGQSQLQKHEGNNKAGMVNEMDFPIFLKLMIPFQLSKSALEKAHETDMILATLIATVSFAVALQVPGGYESDGPYLGLPILRHKSRFKVFMIFDAVAFGLSSSSIFFLFMSSRIENSTRRAIFLGISFVAIFYSILAMLGTFISGIYLISGNSNGIQASVYGCIAVFLYSLIYLVLFNFACCMCRKLVRFIIAVSV